MSYEYELPDDCVSIVRGKKYPPRLCEMLDSVWGYGSERLWDKIEGKLRRIQVLPVCGATLARQVSCRASPCFRHAQPKLPTIRAPVAAYPQALSIPESGLVLGDVPLQHLAARNLNEEISVLRTIFAHKEAINTKMKNVRFLSIQQYTRGQTGDPVGTLYTFTQVEQRPWIVLHVLLLTTYVCIPGA
jgi:hypothetical protein